MDISKEEKKAISIVENIKFKKYKIYIAKEMKDEIRFYQTEEERKAIDIVLNLIEKLQKENEELKEQKEIDMYLIGDSISKEIVKRDYIPKDKIRDKLDEIMSYTFTSIEERHQQNYAYDRIRELLEEE